MVRRIISAAVNRILRPLKLEIRQITPKQTKKHPRESLFGAMQHLKAQGFQPGAVIDVGAAGGTPALQRTFRDAHHLLIEPLEEFSASLKALAQEYPHLDYVFGVASSTSGEMTINVYKDSLQGSSVYTEDEATGVVSIPRTVPSHTLNELRDRYQLKPPYLLKIDVQGATLAVLAGADRLLHDTEYLIVETEMFKFFEEGAILDEVIRYMGDRGFVPYEIIGHVYRPLDGALAQIDVAFVKRDGRFRQHQLFATSEQRAAMIK